MEAVTLSEVKIYVGTYGKYNAGSIFGKCLDLSNYSDKDEFNEACRELHKDEEDAEYMYQDWENIPDSLIGESWLSEKFFELRDAVEDIWTTPVRKPISYGATTKDMILRKSMQTTL